MFLLEFLCYPAIDDQTVIVKELFTDFDVTQGLKKNAHAILFGFQIGFAGVIDPFGGIAILFGIDDVPVVQVEIEGVVGLAGIMGVESLRLPPCNDFTLILQHSIAGLDGTDGVDALAVDTGHAHLRAAATGFRTDHSIRLFEFILVLRQVKNFLIWNWRIYRQ